MKTNGPSNILGGGHVNVQNNVFWPEGITKYCYSDSISQWGYIPGSHHEITGKRLPDRNVEAWNKSSSLMIVDKW